MAAKHWKNRAIRAKQRAVKPVDLYAHPDGPEPGTIDSIRGSIRRPDPHQIVLMYELHDPDEKLVIPAGTGMRRDDLWRETCFEFFLGRASGDDYREFNFSPGGDWAAYEFDRYRQGQRHHLMPADPVIRCTRDGDTLTVEATLTLADMPENGSCQMAAVIDEENRAQVHWAALHAPGKPDFHDRLSFAVHYPKLEQA